MSDDVLTLEMIDEAKEKAEWVGPAVVEPIRADDGTKWYLFRKNEVWSNSRGEWVKL